MRASSLPGMSIRDIFEGPASERFPFWVAPWREGPTIAYVFDFFIDMRRGGLTGDFAVNVFDLEARGFVAGPRGSRLIARIVDDGEDGWLHVHVDYQGHQLLRLPLVTPKGSELETWPRKHLPPNSIRSRR